MHHVVLDCRAWSPRISTDEENMPAAFQVSFVSGVAQMAGEIKTADVEKIGFVENWTWLPRGKRNAPSGAESAEFEGVLHERPSRGALRRIGQFLFLLS